MSLFKDLRDITRECKGYNYINDFYHILESSTKDVVANPASLLGDQWDKKESNEMVNWFKAAKNVAKSEMDSHEATVDAILNSVYKRSKIEHFILRKYVIIYLDIKLVYLWFIHLFYRKKFDEAMAERAYQYMLENTGLEEEDEDE